MDDVQCVFNTTHSKFSFKIKNVDTCFQLPFIICLTLTLPFPLTQQLPPKEKPLPLHVSLYRIEEERQNVVRRTQTRLANLQATPLPVHQTLTPQEELPLNEPPVPIPGYITFPFGFCVGILLSALSFALAYLNDCVCSCTCA